MTTDGEDRPPGAVDARFTLAAERTMLAWLRTALGLIAAGVAVLHLFDPFGAAGTRTALGVSLVVLGALTAVTGFYRWRRTEQALRSGGPMHSPWPIAVLTGLLVAVAIGFAVFS
ncbi:YidH family protein [Gordonia sp. VNK21]|uniref:YidH family protein n=1 Tax=Gordonia sp. VNK21 TaxID=3382483 RepID=UPI0038D3C2C1